MTKDEILILAGQKAEAKGLNPLIIQSIVMVESRGDPFAARYEEQWRYFHFTGQHASRLRISELTERRLQMFSWGLMQVMGSVCRELGFLGPLPKVCEPDVGLELGCQKFKICLARWGNEMDAISSYNQGNPHKTGADYKNQQYVDHVLAHRDLLAKR